MTGAFDQFSFHVRCGVRRLFSSSFFLGGVGLWTCDDVFELSIHSRNHSSPLRVCKLFYFHIRLFVYPIRCLEMFISLLDLHFVYLIGVLSCSMLCFFSAIFLCVFRVACLDYMSGGWNLRCSPSALFFVFLCREGGVATVVFSWLHVFGACLTPRQFQQLSFLACRALCHVSCVNVLNAQQPFRMWKLQHFLHFHFLECLTLTSLSFTQFFFCVLLHCWWTRIIGVHFVFL